MGQLIFYSLSFCCLEFAKSKQKNISFVIQYHYYINFITITIIIIIINVTVIENNNAAMTHLSCFHQGSSLKPQWPL